MSANPLDVTQYLTNRGHTVKIAYFENSKIKIGNEFSLYGYLIVYRIENNEFIVCSLEVSDSRALPGDFLRLFNFLRSLGRDITELSTVRMLIIDNIASPMLQSMRHRLIKLLIAKGAFSKNIDGDDWLLFDVSSGKSNKE